MASGEGGDRDWTKTAVAVIIGLTSVVSALFTWRAARLDADATFLDRSASAQEVRNRSYDAAVDLRLRVLDEDYVDYVVERAVVDEFRRQRALLEGADIPVPASLDVGLHSAEQDLIAVLDRNRLFGEDSWRVIETRPVYDRAARAELVGIEVRSRVGAPIRGEPEIFADGADRKRADSLSLIRWTVLLVAVIVVLTGAELAHRREVRMTLGISSTVTIVTILATVVSRGLL